MGEVALVLVEVVVPVLALKVLALVLKVLKVPALVLKVLALAQMVLAFVQMAGGRVVPILVVNVPVLRHPKGVMRRVVKKARLVSLLRAANPKERPVDEAYASAFPEEAPDALDEAFRAWFDSNY